MLGYVKSLISLQTREVCQEVTEKFPSLLVHAVSQESACALIREIAWYVPDQVDRIFWMNDSGKFRVEMRMSENRSVLFRGGHRAEKYAAFIREYMLGQWGHFDSVQMESHYRERGILVYSDRTELERFNGSFSDYYDRILFGHVQVDDFRARYPTVRVADSDLPAMAIADSRNGIVMLGKADPDRPDFRSDLNKALSRQLDSSRRYRVKPRRRGAHKEIPESRMFWCMGITFTTIVGTITMIVRSTMRCLNHDLPIFSGA
jgi:hypothetical protein